MRCNDKKDIDYNKELASRNHFANLSNSLARSPKRTGQIVFDNLSRDRSLDRTLCLSYLYCASSWSIVIHLMMVDRNKSARSSTKFGGREKTDCKLRPPVEDHSSRTASSSEQSRFVWVNYSELCQERAGQIELNICLPIVRLIILVHT